MSVDTKRPHSDASTTTKPVENCVDFQLLDFSEDVLEDVLFWLPPTRLDVCRLELVCRRIRRILLGRRFWSNMARNLALPRFTITRLGVNVTRYTATPSLSIDLQFTAADAHDTEKLERHSKKLVQFVRSLPQFAADLWPRFPCSILQIDDERGPCCFTWFGMIFVEHFAETVNRPLFKSYSVQAHFYLAAQGEHVGVAVGTTLLELVFTLTIATNRASVLLCDGARVIGSKHATASIISLARYAWTFFAERERAHGTYFDAMLRAGRRKATLAEMCERCRAQRFREN